MAVNEITKRFSVVAFVAGVFSAVLATRIEPFKSNFALAILGTFAVGITCGLFEVAARGVVRKLKRASR